MFELFFYKIFLIWNMENFIDLIIGLCLVVFLLSGITYFILMVKRKIYLIKCSLKNRKFEDKRLINKINQFMNAVFFDPDFHFFSRKQNRINFATKEENQLNEKYFKYINLSLSVSLASILLVFIIEFLFKK